MSISRNILLERPLRQRKKGHQAVGREGDPNSNEHRLQIDAHRGEARRKTQAARTKANPYDRALETEETRGGVLGKNNNSREKS